MKKLILFLLIGVLLLLPLSGCFADNKQNEGTTPNNTTENTTPEGTTPEATTPEVTTPEVTTPDNPPEVTTPDNPPEETPSDNNEVTVPDPPTVTIPLEGNKNHQPIVAGEVDKNSDLIVTLVDYLDLYWKDVNIAGKTFGEKIDNIKDGTQPLLVVFNPDDYYFVCAYYNPTHGGSESRFCCAEEYTWVRYTSEEEIQEYYNGMKFVVAFQMNRSLLVTNIISNDSDTDLEHFILYDPIFENGVNTALCNASVFERWFDKAYIYLNNSDKDIVYRSHTQYNHTVVTIQCIYLDGQYYIPINLATLKTTETFNAQEALSKKTSSFGEYYDAIVSVIDTELFRVKASETYIYYYGVISLNDFVDIISK